MVPQIRLTHSMHQPCAWEHALYFRKLFRGHRRSAKDTVRTLDISWPETRWRSMVRRSIVGTANTCVISPAHDQIEDGLGAEGIDHHGAADMQNGQVDGVIGDMKQRQHRQHDARGIVELQAGGPWTAPAIRLRWVCTTPLGFPVVPDV